MKYYRYEISSDGATTKWEYNADAFFALISINSTKVKETSIQSDCVTWFMPDNSVYQMVDE